MLEKKYEWKKQIAEKHIIWQFIIMKLRDKPKFRICIVQEDIHTHETKTKQNKTPLQTKLN